LVGWIHLNSLLSSLPKRGICDYDINKGVCLDQVPGALCCEIVAENWYPYDKEMQIDIDDKESIDFNFCFSLVIKDDVIVQLFKPTHIVSLERSKELVVLN